MRFDEESFGRCRHSATAMLPMSYLKREGDYGIILLEWFSIAYLFTGTGWWGSPFHSRNTGR